MYSCIKAPFLMDGHTTLGWSTCNYSKNHQNYIHFQHLKIIYVFKNTKSFPKRFFFLRSGNATGQAFERLFPASMCVTCFQKASPGTPRPLAGWLRWQQTQAEPSWAIHTETHIVSSHFGAQQKVDSPEILCFASALQEGGALLASEILATISGQFGSTQLPLQRGTSSPHHPEYPKVMPGFGDVRGKQVWRNLAEEGNKDIYPCYPCNSIYLFAWKKKTLQKLPLIC